ncbi:hypothetical protein CAPTEDRAFT_224968 [Capitella teleta]|uniref:SMP-30/Gluconolactonase/LRE-like region domain-containing protein n=1 Tax=Capitella teleta TaxID=283909 RepID=R7UKD8_CAPTE|nr:hypothetical protein CAPTEDRAFT_224968 [Capitella teleta]|eukprot:ELU07004.1 hypothetical protein CAPTEDRAFT_224968 [Capitella teleta]
MDIMILDNTPRLRRSAGFRKKSHYRKSMMRRLPEAQLVWQLLPDADEAAAVDCDQLVKYPVDVAFIDENIFAVADSEGHKIVVFNIKTLEWSQIGTEKVWPNAIAATPDKNIVVTDRKRKACVTYDLEGRLLSSWDVYIPEDVEEGYETPCYPHGVTVTKNGDVAVTDTGTHSVKIFTSEGELLKEFGAKGTDIWELRLPFFCATNNSDNIVVSDNMNYCVKIFDRTGNCLSQIGSGQDWGQRRFECPYGVCADLEDNIVVADYETNRVSLFHQNGRFIRHLLTKGDKCNSPCGVAVGPCGHLVVTESNLDYNNIKVYKIYE